MATTSVSSSLPPFFSKFKPKPHRSLNTNISSLQVTSSLSLPTTFLTPKTIINFHHPTRGIHKKSNQIWSISAATEEVLPSDTTTPIENAQQIVDSTADGDNLSIIIQVLLLIAFVALSILTVGVIYIAVTEFLQKREKEKFEKEETTKMKKSKKGIKAKARAGPRGFGQKVDEFDD